MKHISEFLRKKGREKNYKDNPAYPMKLTPSKNKRNLPIMNKRSAYKVEMTDMGKE